MDSGLWLTVQEIFSGAIDLPAAERAVYIDNACAGNPELRAEVESLLAAHERAGGFIEPVPASIGPYRLIEQVGRGGMGSVYRAERADGQFQQKVAIKLLSLAGSTALYRRFLDERQILANLSHPNIARFLDGAVTPSGVSYIVMEFVEGVPVDQYCLGRRIRERLELFRTICKAIQYAHQNLVVHRDLKPANILVTVDGEPKLLDFGIAKMLERATGEGTETSLPAMTPNYASPEQIRGRPISTVSDVYSLGVLLHKLLTGRSPYELTGKTFEEVTRVVCECGREPARTGSSDLDAIVAMAMRKEPADRYSSADALSADIERFLARRPVKARSGAMSYVVRKFFIRHKVAVAAGSLVAALLSGAALIAERQSQIATRRFQDVRKLANAVVFPIYDGVAALPGSTPARHLILANALEYLDKLSHDAAGDHDLQIELAEAYSRLGDVQGFQSQANLGEPHSAIASYRKAYSLYAGALRQRPRDTAASLGLALVCGHLGAVLASTRQTVEAQRIASEGVAIMETMVRDAPTDNHRRRLGAAYSSLADASGDDLQFRHKSLDIFEDLLKKDPGNLALQRDVARAHKYIAAPLIRGPEKERALPHLRRAEALDAGRVAAKPEDREAQMDLSFDYSQNGMYYNNRTQFVLAIANFRKALEIRQRLAESDHTDTRLQDRLVYAYTQVGSTLQSMNKPAQAVPNYEQAVRIGRELVDTNPRNPQFRSSLAGSQARFAGALSAMGRTLVACVARGDALLEYDRMDRDGQLREGERANSEQLRKQLRTCPPVPSRYGGRTPLAQDLKAH